MASSTAAIQDLITIKEVIEEVADKNEEWGDVLRMIGRLAEILAQLMNGEYFDD